MVSYRGGGVSVRRLGGNRAGEMRIGRFLRNERVSLDEMLETSCSRTLKRVQDRHVLAIQDTTSIRIGEDGLGVSCHPVFAVDAHDGTAYGLIDATFLSHEGGMRGTHKGRAFEDKQSHRWLEGARSAARLADAGAACVTVVEDREGDIYECFANKPEGVEKLVRASQNRKLCEGCRLFEKADQLELSGDMEVDLPAAPGRKARRALLRVGFCRIELARPVKHRAKSDLPEAVSVSLVVAHEINAPEGVTPARWLLLTSHAVNDMADARRIIGFYRKRWTIEQLFRTMKTKGFCVEALRQHKGEALEKLATVILIAAVKVMQLVAERDGVAGRPIDDVFDVDDVPALERVCESLEGKTQKQKNPHPKKSLAYAAWVFARLGGWTGYYGKPGPIVMLNGLNQFHAIKHGWNLRDV